MLDSETKRRIDTARNVLVGKVPDPKSQVEQITIALIYKFMDDMDAEAVELGGKPSFFVGEFEKYGWRRVFDPRMGGFDILNLYSEAIVKLNQNPSVPQLFRDIFKNAYLPYRDPETLKLFLKTIDEFRYDHSERLGDAFEYLLSVLGSQGDAGQFRTPRHIIDFIVSVVAPKKTDTILDPACGTAGFMISAYKHIVKHNPKLTPDERKRLMENVVGYDISPDMVRLALANMYLHGFTTPHIFEYDTLTSEDRWNEYYDVIFANPPFMSPKGGIKPHKKFSIDAKRSEVLFVDYIAEHLNPARGRAGVIVPEGIIFQSQTAYKQLRKMLVDGYLVAVVSLPAGVFNPYSGVKTSILILDRSLAKQSDTVGFFKIENDGFSLGAQRRPIDKNDLPQVLEAIKNYELRITNKENAETITAALSLVIRNSQFVIVPRDKIAANGDYNLSGERYRENGKHAGNWPMVKLGDVAEYTNGFPFKPEDWHGEGLPIIRIQNLTRSGKDINRTQRKDVPAKYLVRRGDLLISWSATIGFYIWQDENSYLNQHIFRVDVKPEIDKTYLFYLGNRITAEIEKDVHGNTMQHITKGRFEAIEIPLPPLEVQREIVAEIEGYQKVIDGARAVLDNYRPHIPIHPAWPVVPLEQACVIQRGKFSHRPRNEPRFYGGKYPFIQTGDVVRAANGGKITFTQTLNEEGLSVSKLFEPPVVVVTIAANIGDTAVLDFPSCFPDSVVALIPKPDADARYLEVVMRTKKQHLNDIAPQAAQKNINIEILKTVKIPLPPLETQQQIVAEIEAEQRLVAASRELIERFEKKIAAATARVWGEETAS